MALTDYQAIVPRLVRDDSGNTTAADVDRAIASAVLQYSGDSPRTLVADLTWPATGYAYTGTLPDGLTADSDLIGLEYPIGVQPPVTVPVTLSLTPGGLQILAAESLPTAAAARLTYTAAHVLVGVGSPQDTIPLAHRDAVAYYAAHLLCRELAAQYSGERETTIGADGSNTESRARNYAARSRELRAAYFAALGLADPMPSASGGGAAARGGGAPPAAGAVASWPARDRRWVRSNGVLGS